MITMVAGLLGSTNAVVSWLIHLSIALFVGIGFGVLLGEFAQRLAPAVVQPRRPPRLRTPGRSHLRARRTDGGQADRPDHRMP
ncbi:hypothetical protein [Streptomyces sp. 2A115]|uniref:hypothetical protein n=1 Tax=Streptomyces sp. 2A115 TaxID=3457439 RepID=UPI003FD27011